MCCARVHVHMRVHAYAHTHAHMHAHTCIHTSINACIHAHMYVHIHIRAYMRMLFAQTRTYARAQCEHARAQAHPPACARARCTHARQDVFYYQHMFDTSNSQCMPVESYTTPPTKPPSTSMPAQVHPYMCVRVCTSGVIQHTADGAAPRYRHTSLHAGHVCTHGCGEYYWEKAKAPG